MDDHALFPETMQLALLRHGYDALVQSLPEDGSMATLRATVLGSRAHIVLLDLDLGPFGTASTSSLPCPCPEQTSWW